MNHNNNGYRLRVLFDRLNKSVDGGIGLVEIEAYQNRYRRRWSTGVHVTARQWKNGSVIRHEYANELNQQIMLKQTEILNAIIAAGGDVKAAVLRKDPVKEEEERVKSTPYSWMCDVREKRTDLRRSTSGRHRIVIETFHDWGKMPTWKDVTASKLRAFDTWLHKRPGRIGETITTSGVYNFHKVLKSYFTMAVMEGLLPENPYNKVVISRGKNRTRQYLTEDERKRIEKADLSNLPGGYEEARDMFLFACFTGLSVSDIMVLRESSFTREGKNLYLSTERIKTETHFRIRILPAAEKILKRHGYRMDLITSQVANRNLKLIGERAKVYKPLSMHVGRHTFATWALKKKVPIECVSKMLGHTNITTTQIYAKVMQEEVDEAFDKLL